MRCSSRPSGRICTRARFPAPKTSTSFRRSSPSSYPLAIRCTPSHEHSVEDRQRPYLDALPGWDARVTGILEGAVRRHASRSARRRIEVLEEPRLIDPHVRGKVPALRELVEKVVDLTDPVRVAQLDRAQAVARQARAIADGQR